MRHVPQIKAAYDWKVNSYESEVSAAVARGAAAEVDRLGEIRDALERGAFVTLFGQFEKQVTDYFVQARDGRASNPDWTHRRGWDVAAYRDRRVPFETKLALVMDSGHASYRHVLRAYALRNHCAHGGTDEPVGSIDQFVVDLHVWQAALRR